MLQSVTVSLLTLTAVALLGFVLAYWTWNWFGPQVEPSAPVMAEEVGRVSSASGIFGRVQADRTVGAAVAGPVRLLGIVAAKDGSDGFAVIQLASREIRAVREGADIVPGVQLAEVHRDHVVLLRNGARESLAWPQKAAGSNPQVVKTK